MCDTEKIGIDYVNTAMERLVKNDVHYRWVQSFAVCLLPSLHWAVPQVRCCTEGAGKTGQERCALPAGEQFMQR